MPGTLLSGPAGGGKTERARELLRTSQRPALVFDFQRLYAAVLLIERLENGRFPERDPAVASYALPMAEYLRQSGIRAAQERDVDTVVTNSDGSPERRAALLALLGPGAVEEVIEPPYDVLVDRLTVSGELLSGQCQEALDRWFVRKG